jgi:hypothetical protein
VIPVRGELTKGVLSKLVTSRELHPRQTDAGTFVEITERGQERLRNLYIAWKELESRYDITVPDSPYYCPAPYCQKSVN